MKLFPIVASLLITASQAFASTIPSTSKIFLDVKIHNDTDKELYKYDTVGIDMKCFGEPLYVPEHGTLTIHIAARLHRKVYHKELGCMLAIAARDYTKPRLIRTRFYLKPNGREFYHNTGYETKDNLTYTSSNLKYSDQNRQQVDIHVRLKK